MNTHTLQVNDILKEKILVSRESARLLEQPLRAILTEENSAARESHANKATVDFTGVEGVAPSFLDELLTIFESALAGTGSEGGERSLIVANPPTRISLKFEAVARGHGMTVRALPDGSWLLSDAQGSRV